MKFLASPLLLLSLAFLGGCSAFGVATRTDLEALRSDARQQQERLREENRILRERIERLGATLAETERSLARSEQALQDFDRQANSRTQEIWSKTGDLQVRLVALEEELGSTGVLSDSLSRDLALARRVAEAASSEALLVRQDLDGVAAGARAAEARSERLLRAWLQLLQDEKARLEHRLVALEASLTEWQSESPGVEPLLPEEVPAAEVPAAEISSGPAVGREASF